MCHYDIVTGNESGNTEQKERQYGIQETMRRAAPGEQPAVEIWNRMFFQKRV